jgi:hypothetical protein
MLPGGSSLLLTDIPAFLNWGASKSFVGRLKTMGERLFTRGFWLSTCLPIHMLPIYPEGLSPLSLGILLYWAVFCVGEKDDVCDIYPVALGRVY